MLRSLACALLFGAVFANAATLPRSVVYYAFYQDPWCTANDQKCITAGCCDDRLHEGDENKTLLNPVNWPSCPGGQEVHAESILINPVAPNEHGGLDVDFLGSYYAKGATYYDKAGSKKSWKTSEVIQCGGNDHDTPYSYHLPKGSPVANPLCVPAEPPAAIARSIAGLTARGIRTGISILGGGGGDNIPGIPIRSQLHTLTKLRTSEFESFLVQLRAAATVLHDWGITHFDIDFEGGVASDLNPERLPRVFDALRFDGGIVSLTTEQWSLDPFFSLLASGAGPDLVQFMMGNYGEELASGIQAAKGISNKTGYPLSRFRFGIKPQCNINVGSAAYLTSALPEVVASGAGVMLWNLGRDYPCDSGGDCSGRCAANSVVGQSPFTASNPFAFMCAITKAFDTGVNSTAAYLAI